MSMLDHLATTLLGLVKLGVPVLGVLLVSGKLQRVLDDRGLYKVQPFPLLPIIAGLVLEWVLIRGSGLAPALDLKHVWTEPAWSTDLVTARQSRVGAAGAGGAGEANTGDPAGRPWAGARGGSAAAREHGRDRRHVLARLAIGPSLAREFFSISGSPEPSG